MADVFADTSGWANFFVRSEPFHASAKTFMQQWKADGTHVITTNYVILELVALFTSPLRIPRAQQITTIETIKTAFWIEIVHIDPTLDQEAWKLLRGRPDKEWRLVDYSSFVLMQRRGILEAFTTDHHFEQAGFIRLLK